jgi:hypothetical protein
VLNTLDADEMMNETWAATAADNVVPAEIARYNKMRTL